jgi:hypothetical protein
MLPTPHGSVAVIRILVALALATGLLSPGRANAQGSRLFGATGATGVSAVLYHIDPNSGASTAIGPVAVGATPVSITGLAFHPMTHGLFAVTGHEGNLPGHLLTIDPNTGAATDIGSLGIANTNCESGAGIVGDITFRADGTLFGAGPCGPGVKGNLYTINLTTGAASFVGAVNSPANHRQGFGLSFLPLTSATQKLFLFSLQSAEDAYVIDPANGAILQTVALSGGKNDKMAALTTDPSGTLLLGVTTDFRFPVGARLVAIDVTGVITVRGVLPDDMDALALDPAVVPVPTLGDWGQALMIGMLVATAIWMMRRRRGAPGG